jgi:hypothetical protein
VLTEDTAIDYKIQLLHRLNRLGLLLLQEHLQHWLLVLLLQHWLSLLKDARGAHLATWAQH